MAEPQELAAAELEALSTTISCCWLRSTSRSATTRGGSGSMPRGTVRRGISKVHMFYLSFGLCSLFLGPRCFIVYFQIFGLSGFVLWLHYRCSLVEVELYSALLFALVELESEYACALLAVCRLCLTFACVWSVTFLVDALCPVRSVVKHKSSCAVCRLNLGFIYVLSVSCLTDAVLGLWAKRRFKIIKSQKCRLEFVCQALCCLPSLA